VIIAAFEVADTATAKQVATNPNKILMMYRLLKKHMYKNLGAFHASR
jgi:hypothetical protein